MKPESPNAAALTEAFAALAHYDVGSGRGALMPIDSAVAQASGTPAAQAQLERRLLAALQAEAPVAAKEYVLRKLCLVGGADSVPAVAALLDDLRLGESARRALEVNPSAAAAAAMRQALGRVSDQHRIGMINSLGHRRDPGSVRPLVGWLRIQDLAVAAAAAAALGNIATSAAARALGRCFPTVQGPLAEAVARACVVCAEQRLSAGDREQARAMYEMVAASRLPEPIRSAARRGVS